MKTIRRIIQTGLIASFLGVIVALPTPALAAGVFQGCSQDQSSAVCQATSTDTSQKAQSMVGIVINIILMIIGVIAVIMIIVGGIRYTLSGGDASGTKSAKDTIMYAVIGLVVALLGFAIVNFVVAQFI